MDPIPLARAPWARWTLAIVLTDALLLFVVAGEYATFLAQTVPDLGIGTVELVWIHVTAIVLGLLVAIPLIVAIVWLARRTSLPLRSLPFAVGLGAAAFLVAGALNTRIVDATGMVGWGGGLPFDPIMILVAPPIEEAAKLGAVAGYLLLVRRRASVGVREGLVAGLLVGLGANAVETGAYVQLGYGAAHGAMYGSIIALRFGAFGLGLHVATSGVWGVAIGAVLEGRAGRPVMVLVGALAATLATHVIWNLFGTTLVRRAIDAIAPPPDPMWNEPISQPHIWLASTAVGLLLVSPIIVFLVVAWKRAGGRGQPHDQRPPGEP